MINNLSHPRRCSHSPHVSLSLAFIHVLTNDEQKRGILTRARRSSPHLYNHSHPLGSLANRSIGINQYCSCKMHSRCKDLFPARIHRHLQSRKKRNFYQHISWELLSQAQVLYLKSWVTKHTVYQTKTDRSCFLKGGKISRSRIEAQISQRARPNPGTGPRMHWKPTRTATNTLPSFHYRHFYVNLTLTAFTIACITEFTGTSVASFITKTHGVRVTFHTSIGTCQREENSWLRTNSMRGFHVVIAVSSGGLKQKVFH